mgnify:CR=1 FL=1
MTGSKVAILRTTPATVLRDYHELMNLAGYQQTLAKDADTALKVNISWHFFFPASSTTPWQLEGVIRAMKRDGRATQGTCTTTPFVMLMCCDIRAQMSSITSPPVRNGNRGLPPAEKKSS